MKVIRRDQRVRAWTGRGPSWWLFLAIGSAILIAILPLAAGSRSILTSADDYEGTTGTVMRLDQTNHNTLTVVFSVNGEPHEASSTRVGSPNPDPDSIHVGDTVRVYYLRSDPATVLLADPASEISRDRAALAFAAIVLSMFLVAGNVIAAVVWRRIAARAQS